MHSLNCPRCKEEGLKSLYLSGDSEDRDCALFVATEVLGVGIDVPDIEKVIDFPLASSLASAIQHAGRPARGRGRHGESIMYVKKSDIEMASDFLEMDEYKSDPRRAPDIEGAREMDMIPIAGNGELELALGGIRTRGIWVAMAHHTPDGNLFEVSPYSYHIL